MESLTYSFGQMSLAENIPRNGVSILASESANSMMVNIATNY